MEEAWEKVWKMKEAWEEHQNEQEAEAATRRRIAEQVVEGVVKWIQMRQIQVSFGLLIRFLFRFLTCCLAVGLRGVSDDTRATTGSCQEWVFQSD